MSSHTAVDVQNERIEGWAGSDGRSEKVFGNGLTVTPSAVTLNGTDDRATITMTNSLDVTIAYRVKCNQPQTFSVHPDVKGRLKPHSQVPLVISRRPNAPPPSSRAGKVVKLLLEFAELPSELTSMIAEGKSSTLARDAVKTFWASIAQDEGADDKIHTKIVVVGGRRDEEEAAEGMAIVTLDPTTAHVQALLARAGPATTPASGKSVRRQVIAAHAAATIAAYNGPPSTAATNNASSTTPTTGRAIADQQANVPATPPPSADTLGPTDQLPLPRAASPAAGHMASLSPKKHVHFDGDRDARELLSATATRPAGYASPAAAAAGGGREAGLSEEGKDENADALVVESAPLHISVRVMDLLVKNVSPDDPLAPLEIAELKSFKGTLGKTAAAKEQWRECLVLARAEKKRRMEVAAYQPAFKSSTVGPALQALQAQRFAAAAKTGAESTGPPASALLALQRVAESIGLSTEPDPTPAKQQQDDSDSSVDTAVTALTPPVKPPRSSLTPAKPLSPQPPSSGSKSMQARPTVGGPPNDRPSSRRAPSLAASPTASYPVPATAVETSASAELSASSQREQSVSAIKAVPSPQSSVAPSSSSSHLEESILRDASDLARSSSLRVDAACAAARCLMSSLQADSLASHSLSNGLEGEDLINNSRLMPSQDSLANAMNTSSTSGAGSGNGDNSSGHNQANLEATLSVLGAMVVSLEKSKESMERLAGLSDSVGDRSFDRSLAFGGGDSRSVDARRGELVATESMSRPTWSDAPPVGPDRYAAFNSPAPPPRPPRPSEPREGARTEQERDVPESPAHLDALPSPSVRAMLGVMSSNHRQSSSPASSAAASSSSTQSTALDFSAQRAYYERRLPGEAEGGYSWKGQRYDRALGAVARVCVDLNASLPREFPVRLCGDSASVDVVWREEHSQGQSQGQRKDARTPARSSVLRRERFSFDDVMTGPGAAGRLEAYTRHRARRALQRGRGLATVVLACGDDCKDTVEPTVALLMGDSGGRGLAGAVIEEIFSFLTPAARAAAAAPRGLASAKADFLAARMAHEQSSSRVTLSAVVMSDSGIVDLLSNSGSKGKMATCRLQRHQPSGVVFIANAATVQLRAPSDFERLVGVLLGRRAAMREMQQMLSSHYHHDDDDLNSTSVSAMTSERDRDTSPWVGGPAEGSLFLSVSVSGGSIKAMRNFAQFSFTCPCGERWAQPSHDLCLLAEALSCLPSKPPPSLLKSSPLATLLLDPASGQALPDVSMLVGVSRQKSQPQAAGQGKGHGQSGGDSRLLSGSLRAASSGTGASVKGQMDKDVSQVYAALSSLRLAASAL